MKIQVINAEPIMLVLVSANIVNYFDILPPYEHQSIAGKLILMLMPMRKGRKKGPNERSCYRILFVTLKVAWSSMAQPAKWITNETWVRWSDSDQKRTGKILSPISKSAFAFFFLSFSGNHLFLSEIRQIDVNKKFDFKDNVSSVTRNCYCLV